MALATNPDIGIVAANREAVAHELRQARGLYLPQVDIALGAGRERTDDRNTRAAGNDDGDTLTRTEASATLQQRIFDGFEANATVARDKARLRSASRRVFENSEILALDTAGAYLEVLRQRELLRLAEENVQIHLDIIGSLREQLEAGGGSRADVAQSEARLARARATQTQTVNDLRDAEANYARIVGQFPDEMAMPDLDQAVLPSDLESAVTLASVNNPTRAIFEADVEASEAEVTLSEVPFYPAITLEGEAEYNDGRDAIDTYEENYQLMLRLRWNLFRGGIDRAARQEALARVVETKNRRLQAFEEARREMRLSWFSLESNRERAEELEAAVRFNRETRDAYRQQFQVAQRTLLDVLDAENELFVSSGQYVTAQVNQLLAAYRILAVAGQLLDTLQVAAPEQSHANIQPWGEAIFD